MSNVVLFGAFGQSNPGDEALCSAFCGALAGHDLTIVSGDPHLSRRLHGRRSIASSPRGVVAAVRAADAVVVAGGTVFKRLHQSSGRAPIALLRNTATLVAAARASGARVAMLGVGAGDLRGQAARTLCRWIVPRVDLLVLRDEESADVLTAAGVPAPFRIAADPTWSLFEPPLVDDNRTSSEGRVTVALSHHALDSAAIDNLAAGLRELAQSAEVCLQPWQPAGSGLDASLALALAERVPGARIIEPPVDLRAAIGTFAGNDLVVGMRFHALVAAAVAGCRFVAIDHEPKLAAVARRMQQPSLPPHASATVMASTFDWARTNEPPSRTAVSAEITSSRHAFELLALLLNGGIVDRPDQLATLSLSSGGGFW